MNRRNLFKGLAAIAVSLVMAPLAGLAKEEVSYSVRGYMEPNAFPLRHVDLIHDGEPAIEALARELAVRAVRIRDEVIQKGTT
jgi:hypothetical protein